MPKTNLHATAIVLGARGLLLTGASGSGKTTLALTLLEQWRWRGNFARLVADDQIFVEVAGCRLIASAPETIAGLAEVHGLGPRRVAHLGRAVIDGVCRLVPAEGIQRLQASGIEQVHGIGLPAISIAERNAVASSLAVAAWIGGLFAA